nr:hypothetical protein Iba_chr09bCG0020 [Ipomoea batatas]
MVEAQSVGLNNSEDHESSGLSWVPESRRIDQSPLLSSSTGLEGVLSKNRRKRRKRRGFRVGNALQILALDYDDEEKLDGLEKWMEDLKEKMGHDEDLVRAVDEAYEEVLELFEEALEELEQPGDEVDDDLICKAALIFWKKWEKIVQAGKELRMLDRERHINNGSKEIAVSKNQGEKFTNRPSKCGTVRLEEWKAKLKKLVDTDKEVSQVVIKALNELKYGFTRLNLVLLGQRCLMSFTVVWKTIWKLFSFCLFGLRDWVEGGGMKLS